MTAVAVSSSPGSGDTYVLGETIRVSLTFSETVDVSGSPQLKIDMDPAEWGEKEAAYASGSGTASLTFTHTVVEPNLSTQGIAVLANTLELNGGTIQSVSSQTDADLSHVGRDHDTSHKVDWQQAQPTPTPAPEPTPTPKPSTAPSVTAMAVSSRPGSGDTYVLGETITITVTFSEAVDVTGTPQTQDRHGPRTTGATKMGRTTRAAPAPPVCPSTHDRGGAEHLHPGHRRAWQNSLELNGGAIQVGVGLTPTLSCPTYGSEPRRQAQGGLAADTAQPGPGDQYPGGVVRRLCG